jgi:TonB family protein
MAHHPMWRPDSAKPVQFEAGSPETASEAVPPPSPISGTENSPAASQESDFAQLLAKFAAHGGGKIPAELSGELALDIVLNEIVEQACLATGATGAAIALARGDEMVCRASSGGTAPELGTRLDMTSGMSGACMTTRRIQCCDDALTDPHADAEISLQLGVRSVVVVPLLRDEDLIGVFEIFSVRPSAFGDRDLRTLEVLTKRILNNVEARQSSLVSTAGASESLVEQIHEDGGDVTEQAGTASQSGIDHIPIYQPLPAQYELEASKAALVVTPRFDWLAALMSAIIVAVVVVMGTAFAMRMGWLKAKGHHHAIRFETSASAPSGVTETTPGNQTKASLGMPAVESRTPPNEHKSANRQPESRTEKPHVPEGSLRVYENGREIFRMPPSAGDGTGAPLGLKSANTDSVLQPASIVELSSDAAEGILVRRVEPDYPEQALAQRVQGPVLLNVRIGREGTVQGVKVISGDPRLAEAATTAVRQWRFKPHILSGVAVEMETEITLNFTLPSS